MSRPGGEHGKVAMNTAFVLDSWARQGEDFEVLINDAGVVTERGPDTVRGPDVFVVRRSRLPNNEIPKGNFLVPPEVAVEVNSPSQRWSDVIRKVAEYLTCGVGEVWVIDTQHRRVHVYRPNDEPDVLNEGDELDRDLLPGLTYRVAELFRGIR
jgi:Uma2 family endonuclease